MTVPDYSGMTDQQILDSINGRINPNWADQEQDSLNSYRQGTLANQRAATAVQSQAQKDTAAYQRAQIEQQKRELEERARQFDVGTWQKSDEFSRQLAFDRWRQGLDYDLQRANQDIEVWKTQQSSALGFAQLGTSQWGTGLQANQQAAALAQQEAQFKDEMALKLADLASQRDQIALTQGRQVADAWYQQKQVELAYLQHQQAQGQLGLDYLKTAVELQSSPDNWAKLADFQAGAQARQDVPVYLDALRTGVQQAAYQASGGNPTPQTADASLAALGMPASGTVGQTAQQFTGANPGLTLMQAFRPQSAADLPTMTAPSAGSIRPGDYSFQTGAPSINPADYGATSPPSGPNTGAFVAYDPSKYGGMSYSDFKALPQEQRHAMKVAAGVSGVTYYDPGGEARPEGLEMVR